MGEIRFDIVIKFIEWPEVVSWIKDKRRVSAYIVSLDAQKFKINLVWGQIFFLFEHDIFNSAINLGKIKVFLIFKSECGPVLPDFLEQ